MLTTEGTMGELVQIIKSVEKMAEKKPVFIYPNTIAATFLLVSDGISCILLIFSLSTYSTFIISMAYISQKSFMKLNCPTFPAYSCLAFSRFTTSSLSLR